MTPPPVSSIDVRTIAPADRHPLILSTFGALAPGEGMELVNDHDPRPLFAQLAARAAGEFDWTYLERGPATWRVAIMRTAKPSRAAGCCGSCGGGA